MRKSKEVGRKFLKKIQIDLIWLSTIFISFAFLFSSCNFETKTKQDKSNSEEQRIDSIYQNLNSNISANFNLRNSSLEGQAQGKKVFVYFNSLYCPNCRSFEDRNLFKEEVKKELSDNFIACVLFVDDGTFINKAFESIVDIPSEDYKRVGQYNNAIQLIKAQRGSNPSMAIFDNQANLISVYEDDYRNYQSFHEWLQNNN